MNKALIGELEDEIRKTERTQCAPRSILELDRAQWETTRQTYIHAAASLMVAVQAGDTYATAPQKDPGTTSGS